MWILRDINEVQYYRRKAQRKNFFLTVIAIFAFMTIKIFIRGPLEPQDTPDDFVERFKYHAPFAYLLAFFLTLISAIWFFVLKRNHKDPKIVVCDSCGATRYGGDTKQTSDQNCSCGGTFVDIELMKWVEDEPPSGDEKDQ